MPNLNKYPKKNATKVTGDLKNRPKRWIPGLPIPIYNSEPIKYNPPRALAQPTEMFENTLATPSSNTSLNATQLAIGFTTITSTVTSLISQSFNESGKLLQRGIDNMGYNTTLPALSTESTEQFNNTLSTSDLDPSLSTYLLYGAGGGLVGLVLITITLYATGYYSWPPCRKENNEERGNNHNDVGSRNNLDETEKGLLPLTSTPKTVAQKQQVSFMLAESAKNEVSKKTNRNRHQFYKSLPSGNASSYEKGNDHDAPRSSNS